MLATSKVHRMVKGLCLQFTKIRPIYLFKTQKHEALTVAWGGYWLCFSWSRYWLHVCLPCRNSLSHTNSDLCTFQFMCCISIKSTLKWWNVFVTATCYQFIRTVQGQKGCKSKSWLYFCLSVVWNSFNTDKTGQLLFRSSNWLEFHQSITLFKATAQAWPVLVP